MQRNGCSFLGGTKGEEEEEEEGNGKSTVAAWFHLPLINVFKKKVLMHEPISFLSFFSFFLKNVMRENRNCCDFSKTFCCRFFFCFFYRRPPTGDFFVVPYNFWANSFNKPPSD